MWWACSTSQPSGLLLHDQGLQLCSCFQGMHQLLHPASACLSLMYQECAAMVTLGWICMHCKALPASHCAKQAAKPARLQPLSDLPDGLLGLHILPVCNHTKLRVRPALCGQSPSCLAVQGKDDGFQCCAHRVVMGWAKHRSHRLHGWVLAAADSLLLTAPWVAAAGRLCTNHQPFFHTQQLLARHKLLWCPADTAKPAGQATSKHQA